MQLLRNNIKPKKVNFQAQEKLLKGVATLTDAVAISLGPKGRNVGMKKGDDPQIIHDGVTIAESITLEDPEEDFAASVIKQAAKQQVEQVGDGTTVVCILAKAIFTECAKIISTGVNAMSLIKGLEEGANKLIEELDKIATPVKTLEEKIQIATISAEDEVLGKMIGETLDKIGAEGIITIEESKSPETIVEHQEGMQFDSGYKNHDFVTDADKMEATVEDTYILVTDKNVSNIMEFKPFLDKFLQVSKNLVIFTPEIDGSALMSFAITKVNGGMNILPVKLPSIKQKEWAEDIAILTGGTVISGDQGMKFENVEVEMLGKAHRVTSTKDATLIVTDSEWGGKKEDIEARVKSLRAQLEKEESAYEQEKLKERIAKLGKGVAVIKVGGYTDIEILERKARADDSVAATKAAIEEGIVPGGEIAYLRVLKSLGDNVADGVLKRALLKPYVKLMENAGIDAGRMYERLSMATSINCGVDVMDGEIKDMIKAGIVDPVKVPKCAIQNAVSVAIKLMTTDGLITDLPEKKDN